MNDIGLARIQVRTAIDALLFYNKLYPDANTDPLNLKKYNNHYDFLIRDLWSPESDTTSMIAAVVAKKAVIFYNRLIFNDSKIPGEGWSNLNDTEQAALVVKYYTVGEEKLAKNIAKRNGIYDPMFQGDGSDTYLHGENESKLRKMLFVGKGIASKFVNSYQNNTNSTAQQPSLDNDIYKGNGTNSDGGDGDSSSKITQPAATNTTSRPTSDISDVQGSMGVSGAGNAALPNAASTGREVNVPANFNHADASGGVGYGLSASGSSRLNSSLDGTAPAPPPPATPDSSSGGASNATSGALPESPASDGSLRDVWTRNPVAPEKRLYDRYMEYYYGPKSSLPQGTNTMGLGLDPRNPSGLAVMSPENFQRMQAGEQILDNNPYVTPDWMPEALAARRTFLAAGYGASASEPASDVSVDQVLTPSPEPYEDGSALA